MRLACEDQLSLQRDVRIEKAKALDGAVESFRTKLLAAKTEKDSSQNESPPSLLDFPIFQQTIQNLLTGV
jgi:hypothetical protein